MSFLGYLFSRICLGYVFSFLESASSVRPTFLGYVFQGCVFLGWILLGYFFQEFVFLGPNRVPQYKISCKRIISSRVLTHPSRSINYATPHPHHAPCIFMPSHITHPLTPKHAYDVNIAPPHYASPPPPTLRPPPSTRTRRLHEQE